MDKNQGRIRQAWTAGFKRLSARKDALIGRERLLFWCLVAGLALWSAIFTFGFRFFADIEWLRPVMAALSMVLVMVFGVTEINRLPLRRWLIRVAKKLSRSNVFLGCVIALTLFGLWETIAVVHCQIAKNRYYRYILTADEKRQSPISAVKAVARASALFPQRQESHTIYYNIRKPLETRTDTTANKEKQDYAKQYLMRRDASDAYRDCSVLFCCNCEKSYHAILLPFFALSEAGRAVEILDKIPPKTPDSDLAFMRLYIKPEVVPLDRETEYEQAVVKLKSAEADPRAQTSIIYPLILDYIFQIEAVKQPCPIEDLVRLTNRIIDWYDGERQRSKVVVVPNKSIVYAIIRQLGQYQENKVANRKILERAEEIIVQCPDYRTRMMNDYGQKNLKMIATAMYDQLESQTVVGEMSIDDYLDLTRSRGWLRLSLPAWLQKK